MVVAAKSFQFTSCVVSNRLTNTETSVPYAKWNTTSCPWELGSPGMGPTASKATATSNRRRLMIWRRRALRPEVDSSVAAGCSRMVGFSRRFPAPRLRPCARQRPARHSP